MDPNAGKTPEQIEADEIAAEIEKLKTEEGQAQEFRDALSLALSTMNVELASKGVKPNAGAVLRALTMLQAEFVAMYADRNARRAKIKEIGFNLTKLIALRLSVGVKPATVIPANDEGQLN